MVRDRSRAGDLERMGCEVHEGNVLQPWSLNDAGTGVDNAHHRVQAIGRRYNGDYRERDRDGARAIAPMAWRDGLGPAVYLGGVDVNPSFDHLGRANVPANTL